MNPQSFLLLLETRLKEANIPPEILLLVSVSLALFLILSLVASRRASLQVRALKRANAELTADLAEVSKALENEMKWRLATEILAAKSAKASTNVGSKSTK